MKRFAIVAALFPLLVFAQESDLEAQIRADLMQDSRTAQMSEAELAALVAALANEAEASGAADTYLESKNSPTFTYDTPVAENVSPWLLILSAPVTLATLILLIALIGLFLFVRRKKKGTKGPVSPVA